MERLLSKHEQHEREGSCEMHGSFKEKGIKFPSRKTISWFGCPECSAQRQREEERKEAEELKKRQAEKLHEMLGRTCLPTRFIGKTFETYQPEMPGQKRAFDISKAYAKEFDTHAREGTGLIFLGGPGTGKSHLASAIIQEIMPEYLGLYVTVSDCIRAVRETWNRDAERSERQVLNQFIYADLLVLDEVGKQYGSEGEQNILFDVIDGRYREQMPTILMGNIKGGEISRFLGERLADRLRETNTAIAFDWKSHRVSRI